ncbi:MAG: methionyl-tRNA formyltransferase [Candidatus Omnitrophica bacterium]|nr:methionyl-tRNA formyltransferase [Candidatus Omnitrophota bacterium]
MTIIFFGSSEFSIPALQACLDSAHRIALVITTPDQKKGRGLKVAPTVVKVFCQKNGIPVESPGNLKDPQMIDRVRALMPELFVVSSYGKLIPSAWLKIPKILSINVHPSLLPKYRGASPVNRPILDGESETGVTIMEVTDKLDSGDIFAQERFPLDSKIDAVVLSQALADRSYHMLRKVLDQVAGGTLQRRVQQEGEASYAAKLTKEDGLLKFEDAAEVSARKVRGLKPWPMSYFLFLNEPVLVLEAEPVKAAVAGIPGTLLAIEKNGAVDIATGNGVLKIYQVKPAGKKAMTAADFVHGRRLQPGFVFQRV